MTSAPVGIDFGTTNTLVYAHHKLDGPRPVIIDGGQQFGPIPTIITRVGTLQRFFAGLRAWSFRKREPNTRTYRKFKLDLPNTGLDPKARDRHQSFRLAQDFLGHVFEEYKARSGFTGVSALAFSVPETWMRGGDQIGVEAVRQLATRLNLPSPKIVSEPVAAACFFADRYRRRTAAGFDGFVLVYDHGGGTLDYALVRIAGRHVTAIDGLGLGVDTGASGFGGEAFDEAVFERAAGRQPLMRRLDAAGREEWLHSFEEQKRQAAIDFEHKYSASLKGRHAALNEELAAVVVDKQTFTVLVADLVDVFEANFRNKIEDNLMRFVRHCEKDQPTIRFSDPSCFRVLMVGGFSTFYLVQRSVRRVMGEQFGCTSEVFDSLFDRNECWSAIAQGACLVAANELEVAETSPYTFGIVSFLNGVPKYNPLMTRGAPQSDYAKPNYLPLNFSLQNISKTGVGSIRFYIERAGQPVEMHGRKSFSDVLPDYRSNDPDGRWKFGCKCDDGAILIYIKHVSTSRIRSIRVGRFFEILETGIGDELSDVFVD